MSSGGRDVGARPGARNGKVIVRVRDGLRQIGTVDGLIRLYVQLRLEASEDAYAEEKALQGIYADALYEEWSTRYNHGRAGGRMGAGVRAILASFDCKYRWARQGTVEQRDAGGRR